MQKSCGGKKKMSMRDWGGKGKGKQVRQGIKSFILVEEQYDTMSIFKASSSGVM